MASPPTTPATISPSDLAAAAERRLQQGQGPSASELQFTGADHELRQKFRRLIDPGILRRNAENQALASLKILLTICQNLLNEPDNPKFQQFKPTNSLIKRNLIDPKGTVEYARELGFNPEVTDFQPYYTFHPTSKRMHTLRIGAEMLQEAVSLGSEKEARMAQAKKEEKAAADAVAEKIRLAYEDDRKMKLMRDELEKERRDARIAAAARRAATRESAPTEPQDEDEDEDDFMPGSGNVLGSSTSYKPPPSDKKTD
ncbi:hypothetical protein C8F04DRAFT_1058469 [Mycena alexandri]|uniref:PUB domain-containing protein n=1 Tax=Mycena alexandri TaxID=1745969 RepID=A0AAD6TJQ9_9AGAR|nr:hypothetical protein C8F04DRAFT_1058469 [Mycena alexandri]